ncbi:hypothetical protein C8034_v010506 [Colletotrichum sidae]|uniref:Uncharacterized protein n=1 Tax=Colletotrichum sidae TaxID=1347389 RepID=A0A4R8TLE8_9PEZI|nr:hypothetical protein C8034_v010506 [Colletotrichum sidae]
MATFFVDWELWQQMTFCLACAIVVVFVMGFIKLWWSNRIMERLEIIDAEKRAHASEMASTGLPPLQRKQSDIPFGVRAIQSGIEVDGIWISRPNTPAASDSSPPNSAKGKGKYVAQVPISPTSTSTNSDPFSSPPSSSRGNYGPQTYRPKSISVNNRITSQADALRALEGEATTTTLNHQTYQPRGNSTYNDADEWNPHNRISASSNETYGIDVRVPIRPPPVNRHLNNVRATGSPSAPKTGGGVRAHSGALSAPSSAKKGYSTVPQISPGPSPGGEFVDPFATPSRSPENPSGNDHSALPSQRDQRVSFAPDEYIPSYRHGSDGSSGSSGTSNSS